MANQSVAPGEACRATSQLDWAWRWRWPLTLGLILGCGKGAAGSPSGSAGAASAARGGLASIELPTGGASGVGGTEPTLGSGGAAPASGSGAAGQGGAPNEGSSGGSLGGAPEVASGGAAEGGAPNEGSSGGSLGGAPEVASGGLGQGGAGAPGEPMLEPVRVIRGDPLQRTWLDLTLRGVALDEYEGKIVTVRIGMPDRAPERLGSGQTRIAGGAFELFFPQVWEDSLYKQKLVYIDVDGDGACDPVRDRLYADSRAVAAPELMVRGSGTHQSADFFPSDAPRNCELFNAPWPTQ